MSSRTPPPEADPPEASGDAPADSAARGSLLQSTRAKVLAAVAALLAAGGTGWAVWAAGPEAMGGPERVDAGAISVEGVDSLALSRRIVTASVTGQVVQTDEGREVLVYDGTGELPVRLGRDHGVREGATLLVTGRVREGPPAASGAADGAAGGATARGPRRLDAQAWSVLVAEPTPATAGPDSVRLAPDSTARARAAREAAAREAEAAGGAPGAPLPEAEE